MNATMFKYLFGSVLGLAVFVVTYMITGTPLATSLSNAVDAYCSQPQPERQKLRDAVNRLLVVGDSIEVRCAGDK